MVGLRVTEHKEINRPVKERHCTSKSFKRGKVRAAVDHDLFPRGAREQCPVPLPDIKKIDSESTVRMQEEFSCPKENDQRKNPRANKKSAMRHRKRDSTELGRCCQ